MKMTLPTDSAERKRYPLRKGCFNYFPAILAGVARVSIDGNDKHNPGQPLHHARGKSADHADCIDRHLTDVEDILARIKRMDPKTPDPETVNALLTEVNQLAWRALALGQELHEQYGGAPLAPAAVVNPLPPMLAVGLPNLKPADLKPGKIMLYGPAGADWRSYENI